MRTSAVALVALVLVLPARASTRTYELYDPGVHAALDLDALEPEVPPMGFAVDAATRRVTNPEDRSEESWRFRAGLARPRYVRKGDLLYAELPTLRGSRPLSHHLYDLDRIPSPEDVPKPMPRARFDATHLVILAPYDVEARRHRVEVYLGDHERRWFALPDSSRDPGRDAALRALRSVHDGSAAAPGWDETAALIEALRADRDLLYGLYVETFGRFAPKPGPRRR